MPGRKAVHCQSPDGQGSPHAEFGKILLAVEAALPAAQPLAEKQQEAVGEQEEGGDHRNAEQVLQFVLEEEAQDRRRKCRNDHQEKHAAAFRAIRRSASEQAECNVQPVVPEIHQQGGRRPQMQDDEKWQEFRGPLVDAQSENRRQDDGMPQAADREQFGHALEYGDEDG